MRAVPSPLRTDIGLGLFAVVAVAAASLAGPIATYPNLAWYAGLAKPAFNPPNWVFGPVWTALYGLMAFALWRTLRHRPSLTRNLAIGLFLVQLGLNAAWSWLFFAAQSPLLGLVNIIPQWLMVLATIVALRRVDPVAARCLLPLGVWVAFAMLLNASVWALN